MIGFLKSPKKFYIFFSKLEKIEQKEKILSIFIDNIKKIPTPRKSRKYPARLNLRYLLSNLSDLLITTLVILRTGATKYAK